MKRSDPRIAWESGTVPIALCGWRPAAALPTHPALATDVEADVAVVGAGLAGSSLSLGLAERKVDVVLLEAGQPAEGASGRNAGHVEPFLASLRPLESWPDGGRRLVDLFVRRRNIVFELCAKHGIDGDAEKTGVLEVARRPHAEMRRKAEKWRAFGYDVEIATGHSLRELSGSDRFRFGVYWREGGRVNPYLFTHGMVAAAARIGARVYGDSPVRSCERAGSGWTLATPQGSVRAQRVVLCTNDHAGSVMARQMQWILPSLPMDRLSWKATRIGVLLEYKLLMVVCLP